jgi:glyceraldehyde 3-phosphate dehydrogenase
LAGYLGYTDEPLVSSDFIGNPASSTFDASAGSR